MEQRRAVLMERRDKVEAEYDAARDKFETEFADLRDRQRQPPRNRLRCLNVASWLA